MYAINHPIHRFLIEEVRKGPKAHREAVRVTQATYHEAAHAVMHVHEGTIVTRIDIGTATEAGRGMLRYTTTGARKEYRQHRALSEARTYAAGVVCDTWGHGGCFERAIGSYNSKNTSNDVNLIKHYLKHGNIDDEESFWCVLSDTEWKLSKLWPVIEFVAGAIQVGRKGQTFKPSGKFQKMVGEFIKDPEKLRAHAPWAFYYTEVPYKFLGALELASSEAEYPDEEFAQATDRITRSVAGADISVPIQRRDILNPSPQRLSA